MMVELEDYAHYAGLRSAPEWAAACVTWVHGLDAEEVARRFGGDVGGVGVTKSGRKPRGSELVVGTRGEWTIAVEPDGFQGTRPEVLRALTRDGGRAISVYWNENADNALVYAVDGQIITSLDMVMFPDEGAEGPDPSALAEHVAGLPFGAEDDHDCFAAGLTVGERVTGARMDGDWLTAGHLSVRITHPVPDQMKLPEDFEGHPVLDEPEIAGVLADPSPDKLRSIAAQAARIAARRGKIDHLPAVTAALSALGTDDTAEAQRLRREMNILAEPKRAEFDQALERARQGDTSTPLPHALRDQAQAMTAVGAAFHPNPEQAAHLALFHCPAPNMDEDDHVRLYTLRICERYIRKL